MGEWRELLYKEEANEGEDMRRKRWKKERKKEKTITCRNGVNKRRVGLGFFHCTDWEKKLNEKWKESKTISTL